MKKVLMAVGMICLLFVGCTNESEPTTEQTTNVTTEVKNTSLYLADSEIEIDTEGAVRRYDLQGENCDMLTAIGDKVLLISENETLDLMVLSGVEGVPTGKASIGGVSLENNGFCATYNGFVYYDSSENSAVYLDPQLKETHRVELPKDMDGYPVFSSDGNEVYYCVDQEIRAFDTEKEVSRLVKSHNCEAQTLLGAHFDGALLSCRATDEAGKTATIWVSTETGQTLATDDAVENLWTYEDNYFLTRIDGTVQQRIFGTLVGDIGEISLKSGNMVSALELDGVLHWTQSSKGVCKLAIYNLTSGKKTVAITMKTTDRPKQFLADRWSQCVWILMTNEETEEDYLLRWNVREANVKSGVKVTTPLYTRQSPNEEGLQTCQERVDKLNRKHGLRIRIWESAAKYPTGVKMEAEYQVSALNDCLDDLEAVLDQFPEDFLYKSVKNAIRICIVRSINGEVKTEYHWFDGDPFIILSVGVNVEDAFLNNIGYVIDTHVLGNSPQYDYWYKANPEDFVYGDKSTYSKEYLQGETRTFVNEASMESATEDRAYVFWEAMKKDNAEMFQSDAMQKKLKYICLGIRDAWRWEQKTQEFPWEQYLNKAIAYVEK